MVVKMVVMVVLEYDDCIFGEVKFFDGVEYFVDLCIYIVE